jgi:hypothetical protein
MVSREEASKPFERNKKTDKENKILMVSSILKQYDRFRDKYEGSTFGNRKTKERVKLQIIFYQDNK